jgi:hypothetical protein
MPLFYGVWSHADLYVDANTSEPYYLCLQGWSIGNDIQVHWESQNRKERHHSHHQLSKIFITYAYVTSQRVQSLNSIHNLYKWGFLCPPTHKCAHTHYKKHSCCLNRLYASSEVVLFQIVSHEYTETSIHRSRMYCLHASIVHFL